MEVTPLTVGTMGASVQGELHKRSKQPNQDSWCSYNRKYGTLLVVCDGLGSASSSDKGARYACLSAKEAFITCAKQNALEPEKLIAVLLERWYSRVPQGAADDYATTCTLFAFLKNGRSFWASIGDGIIIVKPRNLLAFKVTSERTDFVNVTHSIGSRRTMDHWQYGYIENLIPGTSIFLASDGVADDLDPLNYTGLMEYLYNNYRPKSPYLRWKSLFTELKRWNVPGSMDDRTVLFLWVE